MLMLVNSVGSPRIDAINQQIKAAYGSHLDGFLKVKRNKDLSSQGQKKLIDELTDNLKAIIAKLEPDLSGLEQDLAALQQKAFDAVIEKGKAALADPVSDAREIRDFIRGMDHQERLKFAMTSADAPTFFALHSIPVPAMRQQIMSDGLYSTFVDAVLQKEIPPDLKETIDTLATVVNEGKANIAAAFGEIESEEQYALARVNAAGIAA